MRHFRFFAPILAGATLRERTIACIGTLIGIGLTAFICRWIVGETANLPILVAPIGASAVILFVIPNSPLAQPWSIIGGNTVSALVGVTVASLVNDPLVGVTLAACLAIAAMSLTRCLHPPGGAVAMTAILGDPSVAASGFLFPFVPVALNSLILVGIGIAFHQLSRRTYLNAFAQPVKNTHGTVDPPPTMRAGFKDEDIDSALAALEETFDIDRQDLNRLLREVEMQALVRSHGEILCRDIMSRDVIKVSLGETAERARNLLLAHNIRTLPVVDAEDRLAGTIGLRELAYKVGEIDRYMSRPVIASATDPAMRLVPDLTDGYTQAVIIVNENRQILGLITQTDLFAALARVLPIEESRAA